MIYKSIEILQASKKINPENSKKFNLELIIDIINPKTSTEYD